MKKEGRHRRRKQAERKAFGLLLSVLLVLGGSLLFFSHSQGTEQKDRIGNVDFTLSAPLEDELSLEPGQELSRKVSIHLEKHSRPAWLRIRIFWGGLNGLCREALEERLSLEEGWVKNPKDGYYYYQTPVEGGAEIRFFESLEAPKSWMGGSFCMRVHAEAAETDKITLLENRQGEICGWEGSDGTGNG